MSSEPWGRLALAVAARLEWERLCGRDALLDEAQVRCAAAEFLHASGCGKVEPECEHPDLSNKYLDLVGRKKSSILWALEAKWVCTSKGTREWDIEVAEAIARLQILTTDMSVAPPAVRILLLAGPKEEMEKGLLKKGKHTAAGPKRPIFQELLPDDVKGGKAKFQVRIRSDEWFRKVWSKVATRTADCLPSTYDAELISEAILDSTDPCSVIVRVWKTTRPTGWGSFRPSKDWC